MRKPEFVTFTGVDDRTSIDGMAELSARYPIEWGVLLSRSRQGRDPRYPNAGTVSRVAQSGLRLAAHVCGSYGADVLAWVDVDDFPAPLHRFDRIQVNHHDQQPSSLAVQMFAVSHGARGILQCRGPFPDDRGIDWLFDQSGGEGREPESLPRYPGRMVGYAGGIGPDNVRSTIERINANGPFWLDMESRIRTDNWLDLDLCRKVCEVVYG